MLQYIDDSAKRRLTDPDDILTAVLLLAQRGCPMDQLILEMTKVFYVDLDAFEEVLQSERGRLSQAA